MSYDKQIDSLVNAIRKQTIDEICDHFPQVVKSDVVKKMSKPKSQEELAHKKALVDANKFAKEKAIQDKKDAAAAKKLIKEKEKAEKLAIKEKEKAEKLASKEKEKAEKLAIKEKEKAEKLASKKDDKKKGRPAKKQVVNSTAILSDLENALDKKGAEEKQQELSEEEELYDKELSDKELSDKELSEDEIEVEEFQFEGTSYMKDANNVLYHPDSNEIVGVWNGNSITSYLHDDL